MKYLFPLLLALCLIPVAGASSSQSSTWTCSGPVDLASVTVTNSADVGVLLGTGCTGHIGSMVVTNPATDGVKVQNASVNAAHDLVIDSLTVRCKPAGAGVHQDGMQVLGGARISILSADIRSCRTSQVMLKKGGSGKTTPTDVVFSNGYFGPGAAHTFIIGTSVRSGLRNSVACPDTTKRNGAIEVHATAPVNVNNTQPSSC